VPGDCLAIRQAKKSREKEERAPERGNRLVQG
jgi:hypothetical protein